MSYTNEKDAGHLLTQLQFGSTQLKGALGARLMGIVERDPKRADGHLFAVDNSAIRLGAAAVLRFLDHGSVQAYNATAANITASVLTGGGNAGSIVMGPFLAGGFDHIMEAGQGGMPAEQNFEHEGSTLTHTVSI